jgi:type II secretory pathway predicted ATPase ExeA
VPYNTGDCGSSAGCGDDPQEWVLLSDKRCVLTGEGVKELEAGLLRYFHDEVPSDVQVAKAFEIDRSTVSNIRIPSEDRPVTRSSLNKLFGALDLDLVKGRNYKQAKSVYDGAINRTPPSTTTAPNPFGARQAIEDPTKFLGRQELLRQLFEELGKGGSRALIGPAGTGKSSILKMICQLGPEKLGRSASDFIDLDMHSVRDEDDFFEALCEELKIQPCKQRQIKRELTNRQRRYVLCLDEVHTLSNEAFFPEATRNWLKGMADLSNSPLQLVVASQRELRELFPDSPSRSSPLADFFDGQTTRVDCLTEAEVGLFLLQGLKGTGVTFEPGQMKSLWKVSQGNPKLLQRSAAVLYEEICGRR